MHVWAEGNAADLARQAHSGDWRQQGHWLLLLGALLGSPLLPLAACTAAHTAMRWLCCLGWGILELC
jgi:hypothetical protein